MSQTFTERRLLSEELVQAGWLPKDFAIRERDPAFTVRSANIYWYMVRSAMSGGLYPNILHVTWNLAREVTKGGIVQNVRTAKYSILQREFRHDGNAGSAGTHEEPVILYQNSVLFGEDGYHCPWLASFQLQRTRDSLQAFDASEAVPYALLIFGAQPCLNAATGQVEVGNWARFPCDDGNRVLTVIHAARAAVQKVLTRKLEDPHFDHTTSGELTVCLQLLRSNGLGFELVG